MNGKRLLAVLGGAFAALGISTGMAITVGLNLTLPMAAAADAPATEYDMACV